MIVACRAVAVLLVACSFSFSFSCSSSAKPRLPENPKLTAEQLVSHALGSGQAYDLLRELCEVAPHRLAGSPGADAAVAWGKKVMQRIGLTHVRLERCMVPKWVRGEIEELRVVGGEADGEEFKIAAFGSSVPTPAEGVEAEVLMVRSFERLKELGEQAKGKIIFYNRRMPKTFLNTFVAYGAAVPQRSQGPIEAAKVGAVAVVVRSMTTVINDYPHTGATSYDPAYPKLPAAAISTKGAERLAELVRQGPVKLRLRLSCQTLPDVESANVVGDLVGASRPEEIVLIGGHLDAWDLGQGAHDDGAGIAHCLEAVRLLEDLGVRPKRTIRVVLYMNEENGVRGARAYVEDHAHELSRHVAAIESDRGGFEPRGFTSTARGERLAQLKKMVEPLRAMGMGALLPGGGGVNIGFLKPHGVALYGLVPSFQRYFDFHHSDLDRIESVNPRELELGAAALAYLTWALADE